MKPDDLRNSIEVLKALRQEMHQETDAGVASRLDEVILRLEECLEAGGQEVWVPTETRYKAIEVLADVILIVTNLSEIVRLWIDMR